VVSASTPSWQSWPGSVRAIGTAVTRAVDAAGDADADAYQSAAAAVVSLPAGPTGLVLATVTRTLIEELHPDGLDADDVQLVLARCYRTAHAFLGDAVDVRVIIAVLAAALGIHEAGLTYQAGPIYTEMDPIETATDDWPPPAHPAEGGSATGRPPTPAEFAWHAPLVIADLLATGGRRIGPYLDVAFADLATGAAMDLP
jgi:hypothetical protein